MRIGILTCEELPQLHSDDQKLLAEFRKRQISVEPVIWSRPHNWKMYDAIVVRTPWDYARRWDEFKQVAQEISEATMMIHSWELIQWNADKTYLQKIGNDQIKKIPTIHYTDFSEKNFNASFQELDSQQVVFKPHVGASGVDTFCVDESEFAKVSNLLGREVLAQPLMRSIVSKGEYSFIYFDHQFSHAILKTPKNGEFRVQETHGGSVKSYLPTESEIQAGEQFLDQLDFQFPYARVDIAIESSGMYLMELEVIEPELFFRYSSNGEEKFVSAIFNYINRRR